MLTCRLNGYPYNDINRETQQKVATELFKIHANKVEDEYILFEEAIKVVGEEELFRAFEWFKCQLDFVLDVLKKCENNTIGRKKKVASILEEL